MKTVSRYDSPCARGIAPQPAQPFGQSQGTSESIQPRTRELYVMVKKARKWVKETVFGVAGTILTATVLGMLGFSSGTPSGGGTAPVLSTSTNPVQNQLQNQLAGVLQDFASKASQTATAVAQDHLKKKAAETGLYSAENNNQGYEIPDRVQATSFSDQQQQSMPAQYSSNTEATSGGSIAQSGRYGNATVPNATTSNSVSGRYGVSKETEFVQSTADTGSSESGFKSNTAATVAANPKTSPPANTPANTPTQNVGNTNVDANPAASNNTSVRTVAETQPVVNTGVQQQPGIEGLWEQLVYNPEDKQWYSGGIYRVSKEQQEYRLAFLDYSEVKPVFVSIAGIKNLRHAEGVFSFESHLDAGEVLQFKLQKKDENTFQGYCYQNGVQLSVNAWRRVDPENLK